MKQISIFLILILFISQCKKDNDENHINDTTKCYVTKWGYASDSIYELYDYKDGLVIMKHTFGYTQYPNDSFVFRESIRDSFNYNSINLLESRYVLQLNDKTNQFEVWFLYEKYEYNSKNQLVRKLRIDIRIDSVKQYYDYDYNSEGFLIKESYYLGAPPGQLDHTHEYVYDSDGNRMVKNNDNTIYEYLFDKKNYPYKYSSIHFNVPLHNLIRSIAKDLNGNIINEIEFKYEYNNQNYPIKITHYSSPNTYNETVEYICR